MTTLRARKPGFLAAPSAALPLLATLAALVAPGSVGSVSAHASSAAAREGALTGGLELGAYLSGLGVGGGDQNIAPGTLIGVRGGYQAAPRLRLELALGEVLTAIEKMNVASPRAGAFLALSPLFAGARYDFMPDARLVPFVHAGLGVLVFVPNDRASDAGGGARFGVGAEYFLSDWMGVRLDLAQIIYKGSSPFADHAAKVTSNFAVSIGIDVLAGGGRGPRTSSPPAAAPRPEPVAPGEP